MISGPVCNCASFLLISLCWVLVAVCGLCLAAVSRSYSVVAALGLQAPGLQLLAAPRPEGTAVVAPGLSCPTAWGIFPDQGWSPHSLHWQVDRQGRPFVSFFTPHHGSMLARVHAPSILRTDLSLPDTFHCSHGLF